MKDYHIIFSVMIAPNPVYVPDDEIKKWAEKIPSCPFDNEGLTLKKLRPKKIFSSPMTINI